MKSKAIKFVFMCIICIGLITGLVLLIEAIF